MMLEFRWRCRGDVRLLPGPGGEIRIQVGDQTPVGARVRPGLVAHLLHLNDGLPEQRVAAAGSEDVRRTAAGFAFIHRLCRLGLLVVDVHGCGGHLATLRPVAAGFTLPGRATRAPDRAQGWRLSRFAVLRRVSGIWVLQGTEASCDVAIHDPVVLRWLDEAASPASACEGVRGRFLALLAGLDFLESAADEERTERRGWQFHDRLFHVRSRSGGLRPFGATCRFREGAGGSALVRPPALRTAYRGDTVRPPPPTAPSGSSLADVMHRRRSMRSMGDPAVRLADAAALLHRVAGMTERSPEGLVRRPYPSGGSLHELEFYLAVRECRGLAAGFYHYRSDAGTLTRLPGSAAVSAAADMIATCAWSWRQPECPPQCLVVISSRVPRVAWTYEGLAYRLSLLSVGAALQSLYLVATDLGLHGCAAGSGNPELFARATGMSAWEEVSIGEFGFGSAATGE